MKLYKEAKTANEDFIDWFSDHIDSGYTGTILDELSDIEFNSDGEARAGYKRLTGNEPRSYTLNISEPKKRPQVLNRGKWGDHAISKAYKDPRLKKFWRKIDGLHSKNEYLDLIEKIISVDKWLRYREKYYTEEQLWNLSTYHMKLRTLYNLKQELETLIAKYDLPKLDMDTMQEETR
jgi:hypothetical protein